MSYFDSCENCGVDFKHGRQYDFCQCEKCLLEIKCFQCKKNLTMEDHRKTTSELCYSCDLEYSAKCEKIEKQKEKQKTAYIGLSDSELESKWQNSADMIGNFAMASWKKDISDEESKRLHDEAEKWQDIQGQIQAEITRRHQ